MALGTALYITFVIGGLIALGVTIIQGVVNLFSK